MDTTATTSTLSGTTATRLVGTIAHGGAAPSSTRAIEPRMNGPRRRANGGFAAGTFADLVGGTATVALRRMVPPFVERSFELTKTTALASSLAYAELLYQAMQVNSITFRPMEVYTTIAVMYFIVLFAASNLMRLVEYRLAARG